MGGLPHLSGIFGFASFEWLFWLFNFAFFCFAHVSIKFVLVSSYFIFSLLMSFKLVVEKSD